MSEPSKLSSTPHLGNPNAVGPLPMMQREDAVDPLDLLLVLGRHRRMLLLWPLLAGIVAAVVSLLLPPVFTAETKILPPQQSQSSAVAMLSQLGSLAGTAGGALGLRNPSDLYLGLLRSRAVADALIERFRLKDVYRQKEMEGTRKALGRSSRIEIEKSGLIVIEVEARDPKLAADLANGYAEELQRLNGTLAITEPAQRRVFFERQLQATKQKLADAEVSLRRALDSGGLASVDAQGRATVETVARLRAQISAKEVQIGVMRSYATPDNPDMRLAEQEISSMRQELARMESGGSGGTRAVARGDRAGEEPGSGVENVRLLREAKYQEAMFEALAKQYELARLDEAKEAPLVQVVDRAESPERRSRPRRTFIVLAAAAAALVAAAMGAFARDAYASARRDPARLEKLAALRSTWVRRL